MDRHGRADFRRILSFLLLATAGCSSAPSVGQIEGTIRVRDKTLESDKQLTWQVVFCCDDGTRHTATLGSSGKYAVSGVPVGLAKIVIVGQTSVPSGLVAPGQPPFRPDEAHEKLIQRLARYGDPGRSRLEYTVVQGPQKKDFVLEEP
jgi:hypothetical protein